jgi:hypothetical protein
VYPVIAFATISGCSPEISIRITANSLAEAVVIVLRKSRRDDVVGWISLLITLMREIYTLYFPRNLKKVYFKYTK